MPSLLVELLLHVGGQLPIGAALMLIHDSGVHSQCDGSHPSTEPLPVALMLVSSAHCIPTYKPSSVAKAYRDYLPSSRTSLSFLFIMGSTWAPGFLNVAATTQ